MLSHGEWLYLDDRGADWQARLWMTSGPSGVPNCYIWVYVCEAEIWGDSAGVPAIHSTQVGDRWVSGLGGGHGRL